MENQKKSKRISTMWIIIIGGLIFYFGTLFMIFHYYGKKAGAGYAIGFPICVVLPIMFIAWLLLRPSKVVKKDTSSSGDSSKSDSKPDAKDSKSSKDSTTTKTVVVEKKDKEQTGFWGGVRKAFGILIFLIPLTILILYFTGNHRIKDLIDGKGIGGLFPTLWEISWKKNPTDAEMAYKTKKLDAQTLKDTMLLRGQIEIAKKVKRTSIFGTVYEDDQQVQQKQSENNNSDKPKTNTDDQGSNNNSNAKDYSKYAPKALVPNTTAQEIQTPTVRNN